MKIKNEIFLLLIVICILSSISAACAAENITDISDNYQSDMILAQDPDDSNSNLNFNGNEDVSGVSDADNLKSGSEDENSFTALSNSITQAGEELNLAHDYRFNESIDKNLVFMNEIQIIVMKDKFVLNGNNHVIDGAGLGATLVFLNGGETVINNLTIKNYNHTVLYSTGKTTLNNVNFTDHISPEKAIVMISSGNLIANNCNFNSSIYKNLIKADYSNVTISNSRFCGRNYMGSAILINRWKLVIENSIFENCTGKNGAAIEFKGDIFEIINSKFINVRSDLSGGAILAKYFPNSKSEQNYPFIFMDCVFTNISCSNDGGAIHIDLDSASEHIVKTMNVINSNFTDCTSKYGGAISILGGILNVSGCNFAENTAGFEGGAIYSSWTDLYVSNSNFTENTGTKNAGAIYFDKHKLTIKESNFKDNKVLNGSFNEANAIYAHDVDLYIANSTFDNGRVGVYADFAADSQLENVEKNDDIFLLENHDYIVSVENKGIRLNFTDNEIIVDTLPSRFDARDWGWTTPGKLQGDNDDCWAFATVASIETALAKSTGVLYNLSENYVQKLQLKYYNIGDLRNSLTGFAYSGLGYALSWYGVLPTDAPYDDRGMISDTDMDIERIHVQDAVFIYTGMNDTINQLKMAIMKYGAVTVQAWVFQPKVEIPTEGEDIAIMVHETHFISLIGWDDNCVLPGNIKGAWIAKDSLKGFSENTVYQTFSDIDYYAIVPQRVAIAYLFENNIDYHVNYQTDLTGLVGFDGNYTYYSNEFTSKYDELIGAVGTYFNDSGIDYSFDIYVNNQKVHSQSGVSEFAGFRTIVLNKYIPVKKEDTFKVVFKSNSVPYQAWSRVHYLNGTSLVSKDSSRWTDFALLNKTVCLKVYTLEIDDKSSFTSLAMDINQSADEFNLTHDYRFNESIDYAFLTNEYKTTQIEVNKNRFVINGNNHVIDGAGKGAMLKFVNETGEIIINDLTFKNFNIDVLAIMGKLILNNVNFIDCIIPENEIISLSLADVVINNCRFHSNHAETLVRGYHSNLTIHDSIFSGNDNYGSALSINREKLIISGSTFENFTYKNGAAFDFKGSLFEVVNSTFRNLHSNLSGGAIIAKFFPLTNEDSTSSDPILIRDCIFDNITCGNDGGAIHIDLDSASQHIKKVMNVIGTNFTSCSSRFGGAISVLGGIVNVNECNFIKNKAGFEGGAIYSSWSDLNITKSNFRNNSAAKNAGAIYFDKHKLTIKESNFTGNKALEESSTSANAIYAHDVSAYLADSVFDNGGVAVYADFAGNSKLENIEKNDDIFLMDNNNYIVSVETRGIKLNFTDNKIIVDTLPSRFDSRDWGWVTPLKLQGDNDDCWAFATAASIETALAKSTGVLYNLSQNYVQKLQLKYYNIGDLRNSLTGFAYSGLGYALSWYGVLPADAPYDDRGMISDADMDVERIHLQDARFIYTGMNDTIDQLKMAIMKYGAVTVQYWVLNKDEVPSEGEDIAVMDHSTHFISLIGWDDSYVTGYSNSTGGWISKDSVFGFTTFGYETFATWDMYAIDPQRVAIAYIFENNIDYHVNYQTDLTGLAGFDANYTYYSNEFTSKYDELIGAVGTYFNDSGINYSFDVYVNGVKVHSQSGVSEFAGFRTIILDKYLPVKTGDSFKIVFKSNSVPYQAWSRVHYLTGTSMVSKDSSSWTDFAPLNKTVCLKVYTVAGDTKIIDNKDISVDYDGGSYFSVRVVTADGRAVGAGAVVKFTIDGKTYSITTDNDGIAKIKITQLPKKYTITTACNGKTYKNTVTVKQVLTASKVTIKKKTAKKLVLKAKLKINGKLVKGKKITFKFKGKKYTVKTNKNGIAKKTLKKKVIKKLKKGKTYKVKVSYGKDTIKTTVKVK